MATLVTADFEDGYEISRSLAGAQVRIHHAVLGAVLVADHVAQFVSQDRHQVHRMRSAECGMRNG